MAASDGIGRHQGGTELANERHRTVSVFAFLSAGADAKANTLGAAAHSSEVTALPLSPSHSLVMPSAV